MVGEDGTPVYVKFATVINLTDGKTPPTDRPDEPSVDKEIVSKSKGWAVAVADPASAQAIAAVYAHVRGAVADGTLTSATVWPALKQATDSALALMNGKSWTPFRDGVTAVATLAQQRGKLNTPEQIEQMLLSVQQGVELAADGATAISMDQIIEIARRTNTAIDGATK